MERDITTTVDLVQVIQTMCYTPVHKKIVTKNFYINPSIHYDPPHIYHLHVNCKVVLVFGYLHHNIYVGRFYVRIQ